MRFKAVSQEMKGADFNADAFIFSLFAFDQQMVYSIFILRIMTQNKGDRVLSTLSPCHSHPPIKELIRFGICVRSAMNVI